MRSGLYSRNRRRRRLVRTSLFECLEARRLLAGDTLEENDSFEQARVLPSGSQTHSGLTIDAGGDDDFYRWTASAAPSGTLDVDVLFEHDAGDLDLEIYDSNQNLLAISESVGDREHVRLTVSQASSYFVRVFGGPEVTNPAYVLVLREIEPDSLEPNNTPAQAHDLESAEPLLEDLTLHVASDVDLFRFTAPHDGLFQAHVAFDHDLGDVDVRLYSDNGGQLGQLLDASESSEDSEHVSTELETGESVFVQVFAADETVSPQYDLDVVFGAPPTLGSISPQTTHMNTPLTIPLVVEDVDTPLESLIFSATSNNPDLVPSENIEFDVHESTATMTIRPLQGQSGSVNISVTVSDGDTGSATTSFFLLVFPFDPVSPRIEAVRMGSTKWSSAFRQAVDPELQLGYSVEAGSKQLTTLGWINLDQVHVTFNEDVVAQSGDLSLYGVNVANYSTTGFTYDPATFTATWTLPSAVGADKLLLSIADSVADVAGNPLDGEWTNGQSAFPSGDGVAGGDFEFRIHVLPGDAVKDALNAVLVNDVVRVRQAQFSQSVLNDLDGNGFVLVNDVVAARQRQFSQLPAGEPAVPAPPQPLILMATAGDYQTGDSQEEKSAAGPADAPIRDAAFASWFDQGLRRTRRR